MPTFTKEGNSPYSHWLINGNRDWALIPKGTIKGINVDLPLRIPVGNKAWGYDHVFRNIGRRRWIQDYCPTLHEFLYLKLGQSGSIFSTYSNDSMQVIMRIQPAALLILRLVDRSPGNEHLSFTTIYPRNMGVDGDFLGRYLSDFRTPEDWDKPTPCTKLTDK